MFVLGLQGSPRIKGNTAWLLSEFLNEAEKHGARTITVNAAEKNIHPCIECRTCERTGFCSIDDDMTEIYGLMRKADLVVMASPVFFYTVTAQMKALIDRTQTLWARKYRLNLEDPGRKWRKGFLLSAGATRGKNLFEGMGLTAKYFFDALSASYAGSLVYRQIEDPGDIDRHPSALNEVKEKAAELMSHKKKKIIFVCRENACRSQMAGAFAQIIAGDRLDVMTGGSEPAPEINEMIIRVMKEKNIDMDFRKPQSLDDAVRGASPDIVVTMGCEVSCPVFPGAEIIQWDLPDPAGKPADFMRRLRDEIQEKVTALINNLQQ